MSSKNNQQQESTKAKRRKRIPLGIKQSKLSVMDKDPGYHYRWVNDDPPGRVQQALAGGYEFVENADTQADEDHGGRNDSLGCRVSRVVGKTASGAPQKSYLMRIKEEFYREDQQAKQAELDELDNVINRGETKPVENSYIPSNGIKHSVSDNPNAR